MAAGAQSPPRRARPFSGFGQAEDSARRSSSARPSNAAYFGPPIYSFERHRRAQLMRQKCLTDTPSDRHSIDTAPTVDVLRMAVYCPESIATDDVKATDLWYDNCPH